MGPLADFLLIGTTEGRIIADEIKREIGQVKTIFYTSRPDWAAERLFRVMASVVSRDGIHMCRTIEELSDQICPHAHPSVAVILTATRGELARLMAIRKALTETNLILVIPDSEKETVVLGHSLYPRFLSYADGDFLDVAAVLGKMSEHAHTEAAGMMDDMFNSEDIEDKARVPSAVAHHCSMQANGQRDPWGRRGYVG
ncbi:MAG: hypothetical protein SWE60_14495 [Thermodesulfobacteriota bacterium]|nr:hypothetical protein [Thermodesulfobacteriota bacterium]